MAEPHDAADRGGVAIERTTIFYERADQLDEKIRVLEGEIEPVHERIRGLQGKISPDDLAFLGS